MRALPGTRAAVVLAVAGGLLGAAAHAQPIGACCVTDGTCVILTEAECAVLLRGDLNCDGAITFGDINPFVMRLADPDQYATQYPDCLAANADVNGDGTVSFGDINPFVALIVAGEGPTGVWRGAGTSCAACTESLGACCLSDASCVAALPVSDCAALGGQWQGAETSCEPNPCSQPVGACCRPGSPCYVLPAELCELYGGTWLGADTTCEPDPCPAPTGACCPPDGLCLMTTEAECAGNWLGVESSCDSNPCPQPTGACCLADGVCVDATAATCASLSGTWQGAEVPCAEGLCSPAPDCNGNGIPDSEDIAAGTSLDCDANGVPDECQPDTDQDGVIDACDGCPNDPHKIAPGVCGCGTPDADADHDGTPDCVDGCPNDPDKTEPGVCGCGTPDTDTDGDGVPDCVDGCPADPLKTEPGVCGCGTPDTDTDGDGVPDCVDGCPTDPLKTEPGVCGCGTPDTDTDGDGVPDCIDNCPTVANPDQADTNSDGTGDVCTDDQSGRPVPPPADSSFIRGLIDIITGHPDSANAGYSGDVLSGVIDALGSGSSGDVSDPNAATNDTTSAHPTVTAGVCPATSALLLGLTLLGLWVTGSTAMRRRHCS
jgi:hypothetical protein